MHVQTTAPAHIQAAVALRVTGNRSHTLRRLVIKAVHLVRITKLSDVESRNDLKIVATWL